MGDDEHLSRSRASKVWPRGWRRWRSASGVLACRLVDMQQFVPLRLARRPRRLPAARSSWRCWSAMARVGAELAKRIGLPAVVGELAGGIALGPTVLGHYCAAAPSRRSFRANAEQFHLLDVVRQRRHGAAAAAHRPRDRPAPAAEPRARGAHRLGDGDGAARSRCGFGLGYVMPGGVPGRSRATASCSASSWPPPCRSRRCR